MSLLERKRKRLMVVRFGVVDLDLDFRRGFGIVRSYRRLDLEHPIG